MKKKVAVIMLVMASVLGGCRTQNAKVLSNVENGISIPIDSVSSVEDICNVKEDGELWFVDTEKLQGDTLSIPPNVKNRVVTSLYDGLFSGDKTLRSITVPDTVNNIGSRCIYLCENLQEVVLEGSSVELGNNNFYCCEKIKELHMESVKSIGEECFVGLDDCDVYLSGDLESIGKDSLLCLDDTNMRLHIPKGSSGAKVLNTYIKSEKVDSVNGKYYNNVSIIEE